MRPRVSLLAILIATGLASIVALSCPLTASADDSIQELRFHEGHFDPSSLTVSANAPLKLRVRNTTANPIEFESFELNRERVVPAGGVITVFLPALTPGTYHFFDDFHHDVPQGTLIAK
ncbi:MAG: cupredoxin domain-containing protein [Candidatus Binataceae bacterium]|jgi:hypothetical protein